MQGVHLKLVNWEEGNYRVTDSPTPRGEVHVGGDQVAGCFSCIISCLLLLDYLLPPSPGSSPASFSWTNGPSPASLICTLSCTFSCLLYCTFPSFQVAVGYFKREQETQEEFYEENGRRWFLTGDIGITVIPGGSGPAISAPLTVTACSGLSIGRKTWCCKQLSLVYSTLDCAVVIRARCTDVRKSVDGPPMSKF